MTELIGEGVIEGSDEGKVTLSEVAGFAGIM